MPCLRQKGNDRGKIPVITGKLHVSAVLFCFQSAESCRISHLENNNALMPMNYCNLLR